jgi:hypothetical protein
MLAALAVLLLAAVVLLLGLLLRRGLLLLRLAAPVLLLTLLGLLLREALLVLLKLLLGEEHLLHLPVLAGLHAEGAAVRGELHLRATTAAAPTAAAAPSLAGRATGLAGLATGGGSLTLIGAVIALAVVPVIVGLGRRRGTRGGGGRQGFTGVAIVGVLAHGFRMGGRVTGAVRQVGRRAGTRTSLLWDRSLTRGLRGDPRARHVPPSDRNRRSLKHPDGPRAGQDAQDNPNRGPAGSLENFSPRPPGCPPRDVSAR